MTLVFLNLHIAFARDIGTGMAKKVIFCTKNLLAYWGLRKRLFWVFISKLLSV